MKKLTYIVLLTTLGSIAALSLSSCKKKTDEIDLSSIHTTTATPETMAESTSASVAQTISPDTSPAAENEKLSTTTDNYSSNSINISYPVISGMTDEAKQSKINDLIKSNALSMLTGCDVDESNSNVEIKSRVVNIDRKRIIITYTGMISASGAAHPTNIFYSNTVDLNTGKDIGFSDYIDAYTMAGYVLSDDLMLDDKTDKAVAEEFMKIRTDTSLDEYSNMFTKADFPIDTGATGKITYENWPYTFSYEDNGDIFFSVPVPHALGDYVIVKYSPTTK